MNNHSRADSSVVVLSGGLFYQWDWPQDILSPAGGSLPPRLHFLISSSRYSAGLPFMNAPYRQRDAQNRVANPKMILDVREMMAAKLDSSIFCTPPPSFLHLLRLCMLRLPSVMQQSAMHCVQFLEYVFWQHTGTCLPFRSAISQFWVVQLRKWMAKRHFLQPNLQVRETCSSTSVQEVAKKLHLVSAVKTRKKRISAQTLIYFILQSLQYCFIQFGNQKPFYYSTNYIIVRKGIKIKARTRPMGETPSILLSRCLFGGEAEFRKHCGETAQLDKFAYCYYIEYKQLRINKNISRWQIWQSGEFASLGKPGI